MLAKMTDQQIRDFFKVAEKGDKSASEKYLRQFLKQYNQGEITPMAENLRTRLLKAVKDETDERVIADTLSYVTVLVAYRKYIDRVAQKPPSPEVWNRMPHWKQKQIVLIAGYYALQYRVKVCARSVIGKVFPYGKNDCT